MRFDEVQVKKLFIDKEALLEGHFALSSGRHSDNYLQCAKILQYPDIAESFGAELVERIKEDPEPGFLKADTVCSPAIGGIVFGHAVARAFGVRNIFAEREPGSTAMTLRRGFAIQPGERVFIVEDVITTGGSLREVMKLVESLGGKVAGVGAVAERSSSSVDFGVPKMVLFKMILKDTMPSDCPMCKRGLPVVKPGSRPSK